MDLSILTLYPEYFATSLEQGVVGRAFRRKLCSQAIYQIRDFAEDKRQKVDDSPFGGGAGMVIRPDVLFRAWQEAREGALVSHGPDEVATLFFSPTGTRLDQSHFEYFAATPEARAADGASHYRHLILICGRFEGVDARFIDECVDYELSLGDFILSGGEPAALAFIDGIVRLIPGVLGNESSLQMESFSTGRERGLEYPHYTQPREFRGRAVPEVLLSGDHQRIADWRSRQAHKYTAERRPDLLQFANSDHKHSGVVSEDKHSADEDKYAELASEDT